VVGGVRRINKIGIDWCLDWKSGTGESGLSRAGGRNTYLGPGGLRQKSPARARLLLCFPCSFLFFAPFSRPLFRFDLGYIFGGYLSYTGSCPLGGEKHIDYVVLCCMCEGGSRQFKSSLYNRNGGNLYPQEAECHLRRKYLHREGLFLLISSIMLLRLFLSGLYANCLFCGGLPPPPPPCYSLVLCLLFSLCLFSPFSSVVLSLCLWKCLPSLVCL
jgi:hypothetical protein